jgi:MFS family permease
MQPALLHLTRSQERALSRVANSIICVHGISSFCYGLVFPYTGIYLSDTPSVGTRGVALYYGGSGVANLAVALVLAAGLIRPPRIALAVTGNLLSCIGYLVLSMVSDTPMVFAAAVANGAGQGCFLAAIIPIVNSLVAERDRRRVFARRYQVLNATLAAGSLVAGLAVTALSRDAILYLIVVNAIGYVPIAATLIRYRGAVRVGEQARAGAADGDVATGEAGSGMPVALLLKAALAVTAFQLGVYLFGYSQFEATMPLVVDKLMHVGLTWVPVLIAVNVAVIVLAQSPVTRLLGGRSEIFGLRTAIALWSGGYLLAGLTALTPTPVRLAGLIAYAVLFALGECAYSCSYHPWLISRVPEQELTRANALANSMMGIGMFAGPTIGVALIGLGNVALVWLSLAVLSAAVGLTTVRVRR